MRITKCFRKARISETSAFCGRAVLDQFQPNPFSNCNNCQSSAKNDRLIPLKVNEQRDRRQHREIEIGKGSFREKRISTAIIPSFQSYSAIQNMM